jgi:hypothetical protein
MSVATQMTRMMNESLSQMRVPGADNPMAQPSNLYYAILDGSQAGPFSEAEILHLISEKKITPSTYMWKPGMMGWKLVSEFPDVLRLVALTPPAFKK